ncbi:MULTISPECIES: hypothetical protein [unclassified Streptomyces]|uniref:hypothetical protein n=1 Tax=unclassified Streptomyces TaxID=2593676 RepID=UPI00368B13F5
MTETIARLRDLTDSGDYAYYTDIAAFMADRPGPAPGRAAHHSCPALGVMPLPQAGREAQPGALRQATKDVNSDSASRGCQM